jgi:hypothetical protein
MVADDVPEGISKIGNSMAQETSAPAGTKGPNNSARTMPPAFACSGRAAAHVSSFALPAKARVKKSKWTKVTLRHRMIPAFVGMTENFDFALEFVTPAKAGVHL